MSNINFKEILQTVLQKLSVFKNNIPLLMSVIITLIAVILLVTASFVSAKLTSEMQTTSVKMGKDVERELNSPPLSKTLEQERKLQEEHAKDANEIALLAKQTTMRELLSYDIFLDPNISSTVVFREFGKRYREAIDDLLVRVKAGDFPTEAELQKGLDESAVNSRLRRGRGMMGGMMGRSSPGMPGSMGPSPMMGMSPYGGGGGGRSPMMGMSPYGGGGRGVGRGVGAASRGAIPRSMIKGELELMVIDEICRERAKSISVYANPIDLSGYEFWADYKLAVEPNEATQDCWYFQLAYWVIEDIFYTINAVNSDFDSVLTAPVKQLSQMSFNMGLRRPGAGGGVYTGRRQRSTKRKSGDVDKPLYIYSNDDGLAESCTGRFTAVDSDNDVLQFNVSCVINIKSIMPFLKELCSAKEHKFRGFAGDQPEQTFKHNQITVLESKFRSIEDDPYSLYDFGDDPVVELDLICEYIFNPEGYEEIKPETVKAAIAAAAETKTGR
ncbi:MAG: hypothetical protein RQ760_11285 [Sedimentisphaerales bacterium]|nr:hypothetical protein [Sedimentisphaerales bacterium]